MTLAICSLMAVVALAAPEPKPVPSGWMLTFYYEDLQRIEVSAGGQSGTRTYWYLLYKVVNDSGQEVDFLPRFDVIAEDGAVYRSEQNVPGTVFAAIQRQHASDRPLLLPHARIVGRILQGEDNARDGVAIWPDFSTNSDKFTVYVSGLSQEATQVRNPTYDPDRPEQIEEPLADGLTVPREVNPRYFTLHRTLAIRYDLPGDAQTRAAARPIRTAQEWVMR